MTSDRLNPLRPSLAHAALLAGCSMLATLGVFAQTPADEPVELSPFIVKATADDEYTVQKTVSATRLATDIAELPFTLNAITESFMKDIGAGDIGDALSYLNVAQDPSIAFSSNVSSQFVSRGLPADVLFNGFPAASGFVPTARVAVDRVEVLEGPASLLYGTMDPGGVVNIVSKRPTSRPHFGLDATVGEYGLRRVSIDAGGPLMPGKVDFRVLMSDAQARSHVVAAGTNRVEFAPMLQFRFTPATTLDVQYNYVKNHVAAIAGNGPAYITLVPAAQNPQGAIRHYDVSYWPWDANTRGPGNDSDATNHYFNAELRHRFNETWNLRVAYAGVDTWSSRKTRAANTLLQPNPAILQTGSDTWAVGDQVSHLVQADLAGKWRLRHLTWTLLAGVSYDDTTNHSSNTNSTAVVKQNPLNPATWAIPVSDPSTFTNVVAKNSGDSSNKAFYTTDQFSLLGDRVLVLMGGRWQTSRAHANNELTSSSDDFSLNHNTYQAGAVFKLLRQTGRLDYLNLYTSWSQSFVPQNRTLTTAKEQDADGQPLPGAINGSAPALPIEGDGYEAGLKFSLLGGRLTATTNWFQVERTNIISNLQRRDNSGTVVDIYQVQGGTERTRGEELNLGARLFHSSLYAMVNYMHFDSAELVEYDGTPAYVGKDIANTPEHQISFFTRYTRQSGLLKGAFVGLGGQYLTSFELVADTSAQVAYAPGYTLLDATAGYRWRHHKIAYRLQANVSNLQNRQVIMGLYRESDPRTVRVTFGINF